MLFINLTVRHLTQKIKNHFFNGVFHLHMLRKNQNKSLLFIDHAPYHLKHEVQKEAFKRNIDLEYIPARMTQLLQPNDVCLMSFIKAEYLKLWTDWFINSEKSFTRHGNMRSPGYAQVIQWLSAIMDKLSLNKDLIKKSFTCTGITQSDPELFHAALKHVLTSNDTSIAILDDLDGTEDLADMFLDDEEIEYVDSDDDNEENDDDELSDTSSISSSDDENQVEFNQSSGIYNLI
jgi:hypothetical protein